MTSTIPISKHVQWLPHCTMFSEILTFNILWLSIVHCVAHPSKCTYQLNHIPTILKIFIHSMSDSKGFAFLQDNTIYYSPNSTCHVFVPPQTDTMIYQFMQKNARLNCFQQPQWWTQPNGFLTFVPFIPNFNGAAFGCLHEILAYVHPSINGKFVLSPENVAQWKDLEDLIFLICSLLKNKKAFMFGALLTPIATSYLGYSLPSNDLHATHLQVTATQDWFVILMGHLSFLLGHFKHDDNLNIHNGLNFDIPRWFNFLDSHGIPQSWLCSLRTSSVCNFSSCYLHVGIFLDFLDDHANHQPKVKWYMFLNIFVWYPWTASHEKAVKQRWELEYL